MYGVWHLMLLENTPNYNPVVRDIVLLLISFLLIAGTLYIYFRLRTGTFRRVRKLLEQRVSVKTQQLSDKNVELEKLSLVASKTDNSVIIADDSGKIEWVNDGFARMTGLSKEVIGKNIAAAHIYQNADQILDIVKKEKRSKIVESSFQKNGDGKIWINSTVTPIFDEKNELKKFLFIDTDITESKKMEDQIVASLKEKDVLLKEIHHRVKNNLQIIISLLNLQSGYVKDENTLKTVMEGQNRVRAMALVHEKFYQADNLAEIDFKEYTEKLCFYLQQSYGALNKDIILKIDGDAVAFDMDTAMPCGLLLTEVVSNSLKYAFPEQKGEIKIGIKKSSDNKVQMDISDNGIGFPEGFDFEKSESLGLQLITALTNQLDGELMVNHDNGTHYTITFEYPKT